MTVKGFIVGIILGGVLGAGAALLFTPMKGEDTRQKIADSSKSATDKIGKVASGMKKRMSRSGDTVKQAI